MTGATRTLCHIRMAEFCTSKGLRCVAVITRKLGWQMLRWHDQIVLRQTQPTGMATRTITGCALENTLDVTGFAARVFVSAGQGETGFQVVKVSARSLGEQS